MFTHYEECPKCGNDQIDSLDSYLVSNAYKLEMFCAECEYEWVEVYTFSHCELPEDESEE